jgi:hypothetical protein
MEAAATKMRGPWSEARGASARHGSRSSARIADTGVIDSMGNALRQDRARRNLINSLRGVRDLSNVDSDIKDIQERIDVRKRGGAGIFGPAAIDLFSGSNAQKDEAELNRLMQERSRILTGWGRRRTRAATRRAS